MITGFNTAFLFSQFRNGNYYVPFSIVEKIRALSPQVLRFPGGTLANTYDSTLPGYGESGSQAKENHLSRMFDLMVRLNLDCKISYVAPVYQALIDPLNTPYWIENALNVLRKLPQIAFVELGNEICISGLYMKIADKPGLFERTSSYQNKVARKAYDYLGVADKFRTAILREFPDVKFGIPMQPQYGVRNLEWNRVLRLWGRNDAEIQHIYLTTKAYLDTKREFDKIVAGATKPIWVTEWSWNNGNDSQKNLADVGTLYYKAFFKEFLEICRLSKKVDMTCQHLLYSDTVYSVIK